MFNWFRKNRSLSQQDFLRRFDQRTFLVHKGFPSDWLPELLKQAGGGAHIRIDLRLQDNSRPTDTERFIHTHIKPLPAAVPCLILLNQDSIFVRRLIRSEQWMHAAETGDLLNEITQRFHYKLHFRPDTVEIITGLDLNQNEILYDWL